MSATTASAARRKLVLGNWKMNGSLAANAGLLSALRDELAGLGGAEFGVTVPFPYLAQVQDALQGSNIAWGAQDVSIHDAGAYTGEVSGAMLADFGSRYVLVGHSERRSLHGETSELVAQKAGAAQRAGLIPVVCVGETLQEREAGNTLAVIREQLAPVLSLGAQAVGGMVLAYEPVWAIGTGRTASPEQAQEVHASIREALAGIGAPQVQVLYGGSVKAANAQSLFSMSDIDGGLVGGASLDATDFAGIARAAVSA
jgi:triosephosphate isomerase